VEIGEAVHIVPVPRKATMSEKKRLKQRSEQQENYDELTAGLQAYQKGRAFALDWYAPPPKSGSPLPERLTPELITGGKWADMQDSDDDR
jgi:hypothetical protein